MNTHYTINPEFLSAFAEAADIPQSEAESQWAGFSNQLSNDERREVEAGGAKSGANEGELFKALNSAA